MACKTCSVSNVTVKVEEYDFYFNPLGEEEGGIVQLNGLHMVTNVNLMGKMV